METLKFKTNINCNDCISAVTPFLTSEEGIKKWKVDTDSPEKILTVEVQNLDAGKVVEVVQKAGFTAELV